jgi:hypothetical protein
MNENTNDILSSENEIKDQKTGGLFSSIKNILSKPKDTENISSTENKDIKELDNLLDSYSSPEEEKTSILEPSKPLEEPSKPLEEPSKPLEEPLITPEESKNSDELDLKVPEIKEKITDSEVSSNPSEDDLEVPPPYLNISDSMEKIEPEEIKEELLKGSVLDGTEIDQLNLDRSILIKGKEELDNYLQEVDIKIKEIDKELEMLMKK